MHRCPTRCDEMRHDATQRDATRCDAMRCHVPYDDLYTGCLERYIAPSEASRCVRDRADSPRPACSDLRVCTRSNKVTPDDVSNRPAGVKKFRGVTTAYRVTEGRGARRRKKGRGISMAHKNEMFR